MDILFWVFFFLPITKALKPLQEIKLSGEQGGSIVIRCPMKNPKERNYLCRESGPTMCSTIVSNLYYVDKNYENRVSLTMLPEEKVFLVELKKLKEDDDGTYACGTGKNTNKGKTQKVILTVTIEYNPFFEEYYFSEAFTPPWLWIPNKVSSSLPTTQAASTSAPGTQPQQSQLHLGPSATSPVLPLTTTTTLAATAPSKTLLSSVASKTEHLARLLRPPTISYSHHTRLRDKSASYFDSSMKKDGGFHILIPATLGILLLMLLGMVLGRTLQKRRALSKRINRLTRRMSALEASHRAYTQGHHSLQRNRHRPVPNRPRTQNNIYSAFPRRAQGPNQNGELMSTRSPGIPEPSTPGQVSEIVQLQAPVPVINEYASSCHLCLEEPEGSDSHDYINVPCLTQLPNCPPGLGPQASKACH